MPADTVLQLEDFQFQGLEIPSRITIGGEQSLVVHKLIGGLRVIDSLGRDDHDVEWSGWFTGPSAVDRAKYIDNLRIAGAAIALTWDEYNYQVIIRSFEAQYEGFYRIPYKIVLVVVADNTTVQASNQNADLDDAVAEDLSTANSYGTQIGDSTLTALLATLSAAIGAVTSFVNATQSTINAVLAPLQAVRDQVETLKAAADATITAAQGFAGLVSGGSPTDSIAAFGVQRSAMSNIVNLCWLDGVCGRINNNLLALGASATTVAVVGADLFQIASQQYEDATAWTGIAKSNDLTSPFLDSPQTLTIPAVPDNTDGVLNS